MAQGLTAALAERARQWKTFHEWERNREDAILTIDERLAWYADAFSFVATDSASGTFSYGLLEATANGDGSFTVEEWTRG